MTLQEIFDTVATHLLKQKVKSEGGDICLYHGPDGKKCAIGCLIPDEIYTPDMEGMIFLELKDNFPAVFDLLHSPDSQRNSDTIALLATLQNLHDRIDPLDWPHRLRSIAANWKLDPSVLATS